MIYLTLKHLRPGMKIAREVNNSLSIVPLIAAGQRLTAATIRRLNELNVAGVYIESKIGKGVEVEEFIEGEVKREMMSELKTLYKNYLNKAPISSAVEKSMSNMAERLMQYILSKDEYLMNIIEIKDYDNYTYSHSLFVGVLSVLIGIHMHYSRNSLIELAMAGLFHDIGKVDIPLEITNKKGPLTKEEFEIMKTHPENAVYRLKSCKYFSTNVLKGIESHHEKFDGTGYPKGLSGKQIPIFGRILALADVYDALTSCRSYRRAWSSHEAIEFIMGCANTHFDYDILQVFLKTIAAYPVGTIVELSNHFLGIVTDNSSENTLRPTVRLLMPREQEGQEINLATNYDFLNVTITGTLNDVEEPPFSLFEE